MRGKILFVVAAVLFVATATGERPDKVKSAHRDRAHQDEIYRSQVLIKPGIPHQINYQGYLTDVWGNPTTDTVEMTFRIYDTAIGGTELWNETQPLVPITNGLFNVILGSVNEIPSSIFSNPACWLQIQIGGETLSPRSQIVSVGYAYCADRADTAGYSFSAARADTASYVINASFADSSRIAEHASFADSSGATGRATYADSTDVAAHAHNADMVDGKHADAFADSAHQHDDRYYAKTELNTNDGTVNEIEDPVSWYKIKDIPAGFADGIDDVGAAGGVSQIDAGVGITVTNPTGPTATVAADIGTGATQVAAGNHNHDANYVNEGQANSITSAMVQDSTIQQVDLSFIIPDGHSLDAADGDPIDAVYVDSLGNIGIGTKKPGAKLEVAGGILSRSSNPLVNWVNTGVSPNPGWAVNIFEGDLTFWYTADHDNPSWSTKVTLQSTGNVGIGTTTPNEQLEITKNLRLPPTTSTAGIINVGPDRFIHNYGLDNTFIGKEAGNLTMTGYYNTASGRGALYSNTTGDYNTASGHEALYSNTSGSYNTASGSGALYSNIEGFGNTASGRGALYSNTSGNYNTALGYRANYYNQGGSRNTIIGYEAGKGTSLHDKSGNVFLGYKAGYYETGSDKLYIANGPNDSDVLIYGDFSTGDIGIGTTTPTTRLDIAGECISDVDVIYGTGDKLSLASYDRGGTTNSYISFHTADGSSTGERVRIESSGNVGIGMTSPSTKLHIEGGMDAGLTTHGFLVLGPVTGQNIVIDQNEIMARDDGATSPLYIQHNGGNTLLNWGGGNVGIGTTDPNYKLDVAGDINTTGDVRKNGTAYNHPDYVFEPGYNLMSLKELKKFITEKKHLPNMPSTDEIRKEGVKIFEQNRLLLEKLEEAYLYIIQLEERIGKLEEAIAEKYHVSQ